MFSYSGGRFEKITDQHHEDSHNKMELQPFTCIFGCGKRFSDERSVIQHMEAKHELYEPMTATSTGHRKLRGPFVCADCGRECRTLEQLHDHQTVAARERGHVRHMWVAEKPGHIPACEVCHDVFNDHVSLEQHFVSSHAVKQLKKNDKEKIEQEQQFLAAWKKETTGETLKIESVFKVYNSAWRAGEYVKYKNERQANSKGSGRNQDNEMLLYHGTSLTCELGSERQRSKLCNRGIERPCNMCSILRQGFKVSKADTNKWQRFGPGIYTTPCSGKSDDYIPPNAKRRAVFVCKVFTGKAFQTYRNREDLTAPPRGYDSVRGKPGGDLNYDEYTVYNSKAILPMYIIVYSKHKKPHPNVDARLHQEEVECLAQRISILGGLDGWESTSDDDDATIQLNFSLQQDFTFYW